MEEAGKMGGRKRNKGGKIRKGEILAVVHIYLEDHPPYGLRKASMLHFPHQPGVRDEHLSKESLNGKGCGHCLDLHPIVRRDPVYHEW